MIFLISNYYWFWYNVRFNDLTDIFINYDNKNYFDRRHSYYKNEQ